MLHSRIAWWGTVGIVFAAGLLASYTVAKSATVAYCMMYARESMRISFAARDDGDVATGSGDVIKLLFWSVYGSCLKSNGEPGLPEKSPEAGNSAWLNMMLEYRALKRAEGSRPATDRTQVAAIPPKAEPPAPAAAPASSARPAGWACGRHSDPGFALGSAQLLTWCKANYIRVDAKGQVLCMGNHQSRCAQ